MWPRVAKILTTNTLMQIHHCIRASMIAIRYRHLRMFLVECADSLEGIQQPLTDADAAQIALCAEKKISKMVEDNETPLQDPESRSGVLPEFLEAEADKCRAMSRGFWMRVKALKDSQGSHTIPVSLPENWETIYNFSDRDAARNMAIQMHRSSVDAIAATFSDLFDEIDEEERSLRELAKQIRDLDFK